MDYCFVKNMSVCKLTRGFVFKNDFVKNATELYTADEAFYCGTGAQVSPITKIDHRLLGDGNVGPISKKIQEYYFDLVKGNVDKYKEQWCVPVYDK